MTYYSNHNLAYDMSLFEEQRVPQTTARGKKAEDQPAEKDSREKVNRASSTKSASSRNSVIRRLRRRKSNFGRIAVGVILGLMAVFMIAAIIHGQVQLAELNDRIGEARKLLDEKKSEYTQIEMKVEELVSKSAVEKYAQEELHMSKATNPQKEYITLSEGNKAEVYLTEEKNLFEKIADAISSLWS